MIEVAHCVEIQHLLSDEKVRQSRKATVVTVCSQLILAVESTLHSFDIMVEPVTHSA